MGKPCGQSTKARWQLGGKSLASHGGNGQDRIGSCLEDFFGGFRLFFHSALDCFFCSFFDFRENFFRRIFQSIFFRSFLILWGPARSQLYRIPRYGALQADRWTETDESSLPQMAELQGSCFHHMAVGLCEEPGSEPESARGLPRQKGLIRLIRICFM